MFILFCFNVCPMLITKKKSKGKGKNMKPTPFIVSRIPMRTKQKSEGISKGHKRFFLEQNLF
jgi:hypothetical protein